MFHGHFDFFFKKPPLGGRPNTKPGDHGTSNAHDHWFILFYHVWGSACKEIHWNSIWLRARSHMTSHTTLEGPWPHYVILGVCWDGLWTLWFGLSQLNGHSSWLVYEVDPNTKPGDHGTPNTHNCWFILFYHVWRPTWIDIHWGPGHIWLHTTLEGPWPYYMILEVCCDGRWTLFFWSLTFSWSRILACVRSGPQLSSRP
jgi:hypothetical protein